MPFVLKVVKFKQTPGEPEGTGHGHLKDENDVHYQGAIVGHLPNGVGKQWKRGKFRYKGDFVNALKSGKGRIEWFEKEDGVTHTTAYEGEWMEDQMHGQGTYTDFDGLRLQGSFHDGLAHGNCTVTTEDYVVTCQYDRGRPGRIGSKTWTNSNKKFRGRFREGRISRGIMIFEDKSKYEGGFEDENPHGHGIMNYRDGTTYSGSWVKGKRDGKGILFKEEHTIYMGLWKQDQQVDSHENSMKTLRALGETPDGFSLEELKEQESRLLKNLERNLECQKVQLSRALKRGRDELENKIPEYRDPLTGDLMSNVYVIGDNTRLDKTTVEKIQTDAQKEGKPALDPYTKTPLKVNGRDRFTTKIIKRLVKEEAEKQHTIYLPMDNEGN